MNAQGTIDYNSLSWVKQQLDAVLSEAQSSLSDYIEDTSDTASLNKCFDDLKLVYGTLQMVEVYGAAMLAEEMVETTKAQIDGDIDRPEDAFDVLMRAMLQMPDYLEGIQSGNKDAPIALLPLMNDLRTARGENLLSENVLFLPDVDAVEMPGDDETVEDKLQSEARRLRTHYQLGLLDYLKNNKVSAGLQRMAAVLAHLKKATADKSTRKLWTISSGLIEALRDEGIDPNISVKVLLANIDRQIKHAVDNGTVSEDGSQELFKNLLYYIGRSSSSSDQVSAIKQAYKLDELLPSDDDVAAMGSGMAGLNSELFDTVSQGIREDLAAVKDTLEIYTHGSGDDIQELAPLSDQLVKIADTYGMLGLGAAREAILGQKKVVDGLVSGEIEADEQVVIGIAGNLLAAESELDDFIAQRSGTSEGGLLGDEGNIPAAEYRQVLDTVIKQGLENFSEAKEAILSFVSGIGEREQLDIMVNKLEEVRGVSQMLPMQSVSEQLDQLIEYVRLALIMNQHRPDAEEQDAVADVVTSIEYYFEAMSEGRPGVEAGLRTGDAAAQKLSQITGSYGTLEPDAMVELEAEEPAAADPTADDGDDEEIAINIEDTAVWDKELPAETPPRVAVDVLSDEQRATYEQYQIIGDDPDEEILEIFIEEAVEVLQEMHQNLPVWIDNREDEESLSTVRRNFHTLKGSGRLVGAQLIGEFAWKFEGMLNRVIDHKIEASDQLCSVVEEATTVLPQLIEQLKGNREPVENVFELMASAEALADGQVLAEQAAAGETAEVEAEMPDEIEAVASDTDVDIEIVDADEQDAAVDLDLLALSEQDDDVRVDAESEDEVAESVDIDIEDVIELDDGDADEAVEIEIDEPETPEASSDDLAIEDIDLESPDAETEATEVAAHQEEEITLESDAEEEQSDDEIQIDLGELGSDDATTEDVIEIVAEDEADLGADADIDVEFDVDQDEYDGLSEGLSTLSEEPDEDAMGEIGMDPVLFRIYYDECQSHISAARALISDHRDGKTTLRADKDMIRIFHTLYGSARTAEIENIAMLCGATEKYIKARNEVAVPDIPEDNIETIETVLDVVAGMLESVKGGTMPGPAKELHEKVSRMAQEELQSQLQESSVPREAPAEPTPESGEDVEPIIVEALEAESHDQDVEPASAELTDHSMTELDYTNIDDDLIDIFLEEAEELLESCESGLLILREDASDSKLVNRLQRYLHTLKGGARMAELTPVGDMTHLLESIVIKMSEHKIKADQVVFDHLNDAFDALNNMLESVKQRASLTDYSHLVSRLQTLSEGKVPEKRSVERFDIELDELHHVAEEEEEKPPVAPEPDAAAPLGRRASDVTEDDELTERPAWGERASDAGHEAHEQVRVRADLLNDLVNNAGEVNIYHSRMSKQVSDFGFNLGELESTVVRLKQQLRSLEIETEIQIRSSYEREHEGEGSFDDAFDPLEMDKYSTIQQLSRSLAETAGDVESIKEILAEITRDSETLLLQESRVSTELQEGLMRTRMVRFGGLGTRLRRIVRQTSRELAKDVDVEIIGDNNEVDRTVLDRIIAPLEHMLRNAVAHGIELPTDRRKADKPEKGTITITVDRQGADVLIKVADDGAGIDVEAIREKAIAKKIINEDSQLSDHDVLQLILKSGFSTAQSVSQIAGRGVGMDVVDSEIKQLGGLLEINTVPGQGTEFTIRLPLTLAINQALLVDASDDIYAIPLASIEGVVRITGVELQRFYDSGQTVYEFNNTRYELKHLGKLLSGSQGDYSQQLRLFPVLLARVGDQHFALHVDELVGRREIVVKPVGLQIGTVRGIAGATILADGRVVMILEMSALVVGENLFKQVEDEVVVETEPRKDITIMVVDDSITIRKVTSRMLERHGIKVLSAKDGVDASNQLQDYMPDLMLLDIEMPRMDGFELATIIRNDERLKNLPIIMITSRTGEKHKEKAFEIGVNQYLGKPYQEEELMKNISEILHIS